MGEYLKHKYEKKDDKTKITNTVRLHIKHEETIDNIIEKLIDINEENKNKNLFVALDKTLTFTDITQEEFNKLTNEWDE